MIEGLTSEGKTERGVCKMHVVICEVSADTGHETYLLVTTTKMSESGGSASAMAAVIRRQHRQKADWTWSHLREA